MKIFFFQKVNFFQEQLDTHIENHKKYPCDQCDKVFMTFGKYKCHIETESHGAKKNYGEFYISFFIISRVIIFRILKLV